MLSSITVISARHDVTGQKVTHILPVDTLDEAFVLLEEEACYYNFASIEIRYNDFVHIINNQNRVFRPHGHAQAASDRRQGCDRRLLGDRRRLAREVGQSRDRRGLTGAALQSGES